MRTLLRLSAATILIALPSAAALAAAARAPAAGPRLAAAAAMAAPQIQLVMTATEARPGGMQRVHYAVFQRVAPLLAVNEEGEGQAVTVSASDVVKASYALEQAGWEEMGTITVEQHLPAAATVAPAASASATVAGDSQPAVPKELALAPGSNPVSARALVVDVALPSAAPARLEMFDVMGRVVVARDLGALGVGRHAVDLGAEHHVAPGVYLVRLTQGGDRRITRLTAID